MFLLRRGDVFLLCSDGITDMLTPGEIRELLSRGETPEETLSCLARAALEAGGWDNLTALCLRVEGFGKERI